MFRITNSVTTWLALLLASSWAMAHPGHSPRQQATAPARVEQVRSDTENQAAALLVVQELPWLLAQLRCQRDSLTTGQRTRLRTTSRHRKSSTLMRCSMRVPRARTGHCTSRLRRALPL